MPSALVAPMLDDLRYALRMLLHAKGWTAIVVLSLALGIGANAALFSAVNSLLLRQLPVKDPDGLVRFGGAQARDVLALVLRESMVLVIAGVVIGVAMALATGRLVAGLLYGLSA